MGFEPANCPPGCAYAMTDHGVPHCGYILLAHQRRGCDPGPNCKRYRNGHMRPPTPMRVKDPAKRRRRISDKPRKTIPPSWDVAEGRRLWEDGWSNSRIAGELGVCESSVQRRKAKYWKKGVD